MKTILAILALALHGFTRGTSGYFCIGHGVAVAPPSSASHQDKLGFLVAAQKALEDQEASRARRRFL